MSIDLSKLSQAELLSLADQSEPARVLADAMQLNGAGVMIGDVISGLVRLGLRFISVDDGEPGANARARLDAITEKQACSCGGVWMQLTDDDRGWWHRNGIDDHDYTRKCRNGGYRRKPLFHDEEKRRCLIAAAFPYGCLALRALSRPRTTWRLRWDQRTTQGL